MFNIRALSLEIGHHYADDRDGLVRQLRMERALAPPSLDVTVGVLVDDYNSELPTSRRDYVDFVLDASVAARVHVDFVQFESDGAAVALTLLDRVGHRLDVNGDERRLRRETRAESSSVLVAEADRLCCPTLAATWLLARLGVMPYVDAYSGIGHFVGQRAVAVLPARYLRGEATVMDLIVAAGYRKQARRIGYAFY